MAPTPEKNILSIRLTESVVFLRGSADATMSGRRLQREAPPAMLRGLLTLTLLKPMKISSIGIELDGKTRTAWPEGLRPLRSAEASCRDYLSHRIAYLLEHLADAIADDDAFSGAGARRIEVTEEHRILSASTVFFRATFAHSPPRRTASVGPGVIFDGDEDEPDDDSSGHEVPWVEGRGRNSSRDSSSQRRPAYPGQHARRMSADHSMLRRDVVSHTIVEDPIIPPDTSSPPYTPVRGVSSMAQSWIPSGSPDAVLTHSPTATRMNSVDGETNPGHQLEEFRNALRNGLDSGPSVHPGPSPLYREHSDPQSSSSSSTFSYRGESSLSRRHSIEEEAETPPYTPATSRSPSRARRERPAIGTISPEAAGAATPTSSLNHAISSPTVSMSAAGNDNRSQSRVRGRHNSRFSLAAVTGVLDAVKDRLRSSSPASIGSTDRHTHSGKHEQHPRGAISPEASRGRTTDRGRSQGGEDTVKRKAQKELEHEKVSGHGWKEFRKGTYTYPISFVIPPSAPPTLHCDGGSVTYRLKATVHRPGAFTTKLTCSREVLLVACPGEDDTEESDNIIVQRQWENQLHYLLVISGKAFPVGSSIPVHFTFVPMAKVKIYRISVLLEERVDYFTQFKRVARSDLMRRFELLSLRYGEKDAPPLLPLTTEYGKSPLRGYIDAPDDSEAASTIMGPGPWVLHGELQLPKSCARLHFTNNHKKSNIRIGHVLKIVLRVEKGDDSALDPKTGKRRLFDIVVQTPIHILSCRCRAEWTALPRYSFFAPEAQVPMQTCMCNAKKNENQANTSTPEHQDILRPFPPPPSSHTVTSGPTALTALTNGTGLRRPTHPVLNDADDSHSSLDLRDSDMASLYNRNTQFARLVSGEESEFGEAPPKYDEVTL